MLTAEIKINGALLGHLYIINKGPTTGNEFLTGLGSYNYKYEYFEVGSNEAPKVGNITHKRQDGPLTLIRLCAEDMGL